MKIIYSAFLLSVVAWIVGVVALFWRGASYYWGRS